MNANAGMKSRGRQGVAYGFVRSAVGDGAEGRGRSCFSGGIVVFRAGDDRDGGRGCMDVLGVISGVVVVCVVCRARREACEDSSTRSTMPWSCISRSSRLLGVTFPGLEMWLFSDLANARSSILRVPVTLIPAGGSVMSVLVRSRRERSCFTMGRLGFEDVGCVSVPASASTS